MENEVNETNCVLSRPLFMIPFRRQTPYTGDRLHEKSRGWLSPPDPSENQVIARRNNRTGSAVWFIHGNTFDDWNANGCLLWIHGKCMFFQTFPSFFAIDSTSPLKRDLEKAISGGCHTHFPSSLRTDIRQPVPLLSRRPWPSVTRD